MFTFIKTYVGLGYCNKRVLLLSAMFAMVPAFALFEVSDENIASGLKKLQSIIAIPQKANGVLLGTLPFVLRKKDSFGNLYTSNLVRNFSEPVFFPRAAEPFREAYDIPLRSFGLDVDNQNGDNCDTAISAEDAKTELPVPVTGSMLADCARMSTQRVTIETQNAQLRQQVIGVEAEIQRAQKILDVRYGGDPILNKWKIDLAALRDIETTVNLDPSNNLDENVFRAYDAMELRLLRSQRNQLKLKKALKEREFELASLHEGIGIFSSPATRALVGVDTPAELSPVSPEASFEDLQSDRETLREALRRKLLDITDINRMIQDRGAHVVSSPSYRSPEFKYFVERLLAQSPTTPITDKDLLAQEVSHLQAALYEQTEYCNGLLDQLDQMPTSYVQTPTTPASGTKPSLTELYKKYGLTKINAALRAQDSNSSVQVAAKNRDRDSAFKADAKQRQREASHGSTPSRLNQTRMAEQENIRFESSPSMTSGTGNRLALMGAALKPVPLQLPR